MSAGVILITDHSSLLIDPFTIHSFRNDTTGLATAAFIAWKLTVIKAIKIAAIPATINIHQLTVILYAKPCSH